MHLSVIELVLNPALRGNPAASGIIGHKRGLKNHFKPLLIDN
jgi:hypothetical protein